MVIRPSRDRYEARKVHQIIWEAFNGEIPEGYEVDHKDNNRLNNALDNLQLLTHADNVEKAWAKLWNVVSPDGEVIEVYNLSKFCKTNSLDQGTMMKVMSGKRKHHKHWRKYHD